MKTTISALIFVALALGAAAGDDRGIEITQLKAASGKPYLVAHGGFAPDGKQYIDRDYTFNCVPEFLKGATLIQTAGDDKFFVEDQPTLSFRVNVPVTVYIVYGDKLRVLPAWLRNWTDTRWKVTRRDTNPTTLKGYFTLFAKDFPAGEIRLLGNLSNEMANDPAFKKLKGSTYCMYSVVVAPKMPAHTTQPR
jgi:hypothetical protein